MLTADDENYLAAFYRALQEAPLEPDTDKRYVALYESPDLGMSDPVEDLERVIRWNAGESVQLFSGFRGTGKSTELRRLRGRLRARGYVVALFDIKDYLNTNVPLDVSDFLMFVAGAFSEALMKDGALTSDDLREDLWTRLAALGRRLQIDELSLSPKVNLPVGEVGAELKLNLKQDTTFRARLQAAMKGHLGALVDEVRAYVSACAAAVRTRHGAGVEVVLLADQIEQVRGTYVSADAVQASIEALFVSQSEHLRLPGVHIVYTAPPWLKVRYGQVGTLYDGFQMLTAVKVSEKGTGAAFAPGVRAFESLVAKRGDWRRLLGDPARLEGIIHKSGGYLRDLLRLVRELLVGARALPVDDHALQQCLSRLKNEMLPVADEHAAWMAHIIRTQRASLAEASQLPDLARFLDTHQVLGYRNGDEWYDVHPLIADDILAQAADLVKRGA